MEHEELVLRFFALKADIATYKPPLRQLLNRYMRQHRTSPPSDLEVTSFSETCATIDEVFGPFAFRVLGADGKHHRSVNKALFDGLMLSLAFADQQAARQQVSELRTVRDDLLTDSDFNAAIGRATADRTRMFHRINAITRRMTALGVASMLPTLTA